MTSSATVAQLRLVAQRLVGPPCSTAAEVVRHLACLQSQDLGQGRAAVAVRTRTRSLDDVHAALADGSVVRSWPMRGTLHLVPAEDLGWMLALTRSQLARATSRSYRELGLTTELRDRVAELTTDLLAGRGMVRTELVGAWRAAGLELSNPLAANLIRALAGDQVIVLGPMAGTPGRPGREQEIRLTREWVPHPRVLSGDDAVAEWMLRYFRSHGPASVKDFLWWTKLRVSDIRPVLSDVTAQLESVVVDGTELWHEPGLLDRYAELTVACRAPLLVPGFDEILLGYGDRTATLASGHVDLVVPGQNGVFSPVLLHHGVAVASWRRPATGADPVTVSAFDGPLPAGVTRALSRLTRAYPGLG